MLAGLDLDVREGEIVALLGRSGSGKSTLLRCLAGLLPPSTGAVTYRGVALTGANPGAAMVFQTFALLPWLTVLQNVEVGLEARGVARAARRHAALNALDLIGLAGFQSAYPKELSGGMRQRVGFARALVVEPDLLLMDEPFSALDVLTAENLRGELLELWESGEFPTQAMVLVTHNLEEAVLLADRAVVLGTGPGGAVGTVYDIPLPRPRDRDAPEFAAQIERLYAVMTGRPEAAPLPPLGLRPAPRQASDAGGAEASGGQHPLGAGGVSRPGGGPAVAGGVDHAGHISREQPRLRQQPGDVGVGGAVEDPRAVAAREHEPGRP
ncbi:ABC transporter ATP-binding protein [Sinosporangium siamense]|uniref:ABC transporter ATP-binding protein n=1 Tax=Sinosporangium siamense TaxID=1367973 RepID=UPI0035A23A2D